MNGKKYIELKQLKTIKTELSNSFISKPLNGKPEQVLTLKEDGDTVWEDKDMITNEDIDSLFGRIYDPIATFTIIVNKTDGLIPEVFPVIPIQEHIKPIKIGEVITYNRKTYFSNFKVKYDVNGNEIIVTDKDISTSCRSDVAKGGISYNILNENKINEFKSYLIDGENIIKLYDMNGNISYISTGTSYNGIKNISINMRAKCVDLMFDSFGIEDQNDTCSIDIKNLDISDCKSTYGMFNNCKISSLDLSNFDTSNITDMGYMFSNCNSLTSLDLSNFDTSKVENMSNIFDNCTSLTTLNLNNLNTSNIINMSYMFAGCNSLISLDLSNLDTSKVENMSNMFNGCIKLTSLDLSNFDTSRVINMYSMFRVCNKLTSLNIISFNTSNVTDMSGMFDECSSLTSINVSNFDTSKVTNMASMFNGTMVSSLDLSNFDTSKVTNMVSLFYNCSNLSSLNIANFKLPNVTVENLSDIFRDTPSLFRVNIVTTNVSAEDILKLESAGMPELLPMMTYYATDVNYKPTITNVTQDQCKNVQSTETIDGVKYYKNMTVLPKESIVGVVFGNGAFKASLFGLKLNKLSFNGCATLTEATFSNIISSITSMNSMFRNCSLLSKLDLSGFNTSNVTDMSNMFYKCIKLNSLNITGFNTSKVTTTYSMFEGCNSLVTIDGGTFDMTNNLTTSFMFYQCYSLVSLNLNMTNPINLSTTGSMFNGCTKLASLDLSSFNTSNNLSNMSDMFSACKALTSLDLSSLNTRRVTIMGLMFHQCYSLASLNLTNFNMDYCNSYSDMFLGCGNLTRANINLTNVSTATINKLEAGRMPKEAIITYYTTNSAYTPNITQGSTSTNTMMLRVARSIDYIGDNTQDTEIIDDVTYYKNITSIPENSVVNLEFENGVHKVNLNNIKINSLRFNNCESLAEVTFNNVDTSNMIDMDYMFEGCTGLSSLDLSSFNTSKVINTAYMFLNCNKLSTLNISGFNLSNTTIMDNMFLNTASLDRNNIILNDVSSQDISKLETAGMPV